MGTRCSGGIQQQTEDTNPQETNFFLALLLIEQFVSLVFYRFEY